MTVQTKVRSESYNFSFINASVDGVSVDSQFVRKKVIAFIGGKLTYLASTDTNHN